MTNPLSDEAYMIENYQQEIAELQSKLDRYRTALKKIANARELGTIFSQDIAREALSDE